MHRIFEAAKVEVDSGMTLGQFKDTYFNSFHAGRMLDEMDIKEAFKFFDTDNSQTITKDEIWEIMHDICETSPWTEPEFEEMCK